MNYIKRLRNLENEKSRLQKKIIITRQILENARLGERLERMKVRESEKLERIQRVIDMRESGKSFVEIAALLGITPTRASQIHYWGIMKMNRNLGIPATVTAETSVNDLGFSTRVSYCLVNGGIYTVGDLTQRTAYSFLKLRNFGKLSLCEVEETLKRYGLKLASHLEGGAPK